MGTTTNAATSTSLGQTTVSIETKAPGPATGYNICNDNPCFEKPNTVCIKTSDSHLCECKLGFTKDDQGECSICSTNFVAIDNDCVEIMEKSASKSVYLSTLLL